MNARTLSSGAIMRLMSEETKTCTRCGEVRFLKMFGWLKKHHRGRPEIHRDSWCHSCRKEYKCTDPQKAKRNARNRERMLTDPAFREATKRRAKETYQKNRESRLRRCKDYVKRKGHGNVSLGYLASRMRSLFGITLEQYYAMRESQEGRCAICGCPDRTKARRLAVDHDHKSGKVRALLCHHCNTGLGNFRDDPALMMKAIQYLLHHAPVRELICS